jgi:hypothetical protein
VEEKAYASVEEEAQEDASEIQVEEAFRRSVEIRRQYERAGRWLCAEAAV